jgi:hypothetical protein
LLKRIVIVIKNFHYESTEKVELSCISSAINVKIICLMLRRERGIEDALVGWIVPN